MAYNKEKLMKVGMEGFAMVDECYGRKEKLMKVGMEGFALVDECYGRKATRLNTPQRPPPQQFLRRYKYQPQESHVYVVTQFSSPTKGASASLDSYEAANIYGGTLIVDYPKRKPMRVAYY